MKRWLDRGIKQLLILSLIVPLLAACGITDTIQEQYPLESVGGSGNQTSYVYRASGQSVPEVANALIEQRRPQQQSAEDTQRMFLVYSDEIVQLQQDPEAPEDTLIEVDSKEYVRNNYSPGFLEGYLLASVIGDLFDHGRYGGGKYRGYTSKDVYTPQGKYRTPTIDDKKMAPPMTVERSGSIFRRSKDASSTIAGGNSPSAAPSPSTGKIIRGGSGSSSDNGKSGGIFTKPKKYKPPKISKRIGKIGRRR
ncbi:DUF4247 domain-containing protein [Paenibacillus thermotolerans]|uniref:DUF4247 domain-containing protein n=1 Tax=Paenibacillus thermotolerans TaxID=3027807 RepID=UPI00236789DB|nr:MULTISPECIES: DUF4247 domain-containing protein [unclassified Paenibacillus]